MEKVYFNTEINNWIVNDLNDFYIFKYTNPQTNEEKSTIISWTKDNESEEKLKKELGINTDVRIYLVEIEGRKFKFLIKYEMGKFLLTPLDIYEMDRMLVETGYIFTGDIENITDK